MNPKYLERMKSLLKDEYDDYLSCLNEPRKKGFRINPLKIKDESCLDYLKGEKSPFAKNGWYFKEDFKGIGYYPETLAGAIYIQEPSASSAITILDPKKGMKVLDLCAAPGSKSTQIAEKLDNEGFLLVNEIDNKRAKILLENIERCGCANCVVTNATTKEIADEFNEFFDMVLCDAPCSGEGLFRKESEEKIAWSLENIEVCSKRQSSILDDAYRCLKKDGILVYSTCTFSLEENEKNIKNFLNKYQDMELLPIENNFGRPGFDLGQNTYFAKRIFPMDGGEGHFIAKMIKRGGSSTTHQIYKNDKLPKEAEKILKDLLDKQYPYYYLNQNKLFGGTSPFYNLHSIHVLRNQIYLGEIKNNRFEPSHHLFMSSYSPFKNKVEINNEEMEKYLHGEQLNHPCNKGFTSIIYNAFCLGGAKSDGQNLKNRFPKYLRKR